MKNIDESICPICKNRTTDKVMYLYHCKACSFTYNVENNISDDYYKTCETYTPQIHNTFGDHITVADRITEICKNKDAKILDIGCSDGNMLLELKNRGYTNLFAHELNDACIKHLKKNGILIHSNNFKYDVIILSHVIEHIRDLAFIKNFVDTNSHETTILYIETPNRRLYNTQPKHIYSNIEHINNFDIFSIKRLFYDWQITSFKETLAHLNTYASCYCVFIKQTNELSYYNKYAELINNMFKDPVNKFIVWGAGAFAIDVINTVKPNIELVVDTYRVGKKLLCYNICEPVTILNDRYTGLPLIILSTSKQDEIEICARELGFVGAIVKI